jgi:hypothetical protein
MKNTELFLKPSINGLHEQNGWEAASNVSAHNGSSAQPVAPQPLTTNFRPTGPLQSPPMVNGHSIWRTGEARRPNESTPLAQLVRQRLSEMGIRQSEFCRAHRFDQGLLSKIQNSVITNLSLESVLRLSVGLSVPPEQILALIDRMDLHDLVLQAYSKELALEQTANI